jgi:tetratricopeptide (TPR) repeat protein
LKKFCRDPKKLSKLYYSIAETYADIDDYEKATRFYNQDVEICSGLNQKDSVASLLGLAVMSEKSFENESRVIDCFLKALKCADKSKEATTNVLKQLVTFRHMYLTNL